MQFKHQISALFFFSLLIFSLKAYSSAPAKSSGKDISLQKVEKITSAEPALFASHYSVSEDGKIFLHLTGKTNEQAIGSARTSYFNKEEMYDRVWYLRSNTDLTLDFAYGPQAVQKTPRIKTRTTFRLRNKWGSSTEISTDAIVSSIADTTINDTAAYLQKHVFYTREAWMKVMLGELEKHDDFVQVGLVPFSVGRGVALGSAYKQSGFLGFAPGFSIDQYAPGILARYDLYPRKIYFDGYFALLENYHTSYKSNNETIRANEIMTGGRSAKRGTHSHVYVTALRSKAMLFERGDKEQLSIEPYFVYQHAPDQKIEFDFDSASHLKSFGLAAELNWNRFECGGEIGFNSGFQEIRAWDRNQVKLRRNDTTGAVEHYYSHVFTNNQLTAGTEAVMTGANKTLVDASVKDPSYNSYYNGDTLVAKSTNNGSTLYNAVDRFRPAQKRRSHGWFALFDFSYAIAPKNLIASVGTGWSSGELSSSQDLNGMSPESLMNLSYSGFIPMQSVYSGTRLNHLIMINSSTPRFAQEKPWESATELAKKNIIAPVADKEVVNSFVNLYFIGSKLEWIVQHLAKYDLHLTSNMIHYWSPESPLRKDGTASSHSLGTEITFEGNMTIFERLKIEGATGVFFPGEQYRQMKEDGATVNKVAVGNSPAYIFSLGATFSF